MARLFVMLAALAALAAFTPAADAQRGEMRTYWERMDRAYDREDWDEVIRYGRWMRRHEDWTTLPARARWPILTREGQALARTGEYQRARTRLLDALRLTRGADRGVPLFYLFITEYTMHDWSSAARRLLEIQQVFPQQIDELRYTTLDRVVSELKQAGDDPLHDAVVTMIATEYQPDRPATHLDWMVMRYIEILIEAGELGAAIGQAERVLYRDARVNLRTLGVFAPLWSDPQFDPVTDPVAGEIATLRRARADAAAEPGRVDPINAQIDALMHLGRLEEALGLAEATLAQFAADPPRFDHVDYWTPWLMDTAARILYAQDRVEEADAMMVRAIALPENGGANISQVLNYATMLSYQGRQEEALMMAGRLDEDRLSQSDLMWIWSVQACAQHRLGRSEARNQRLALLQTKWGTNAPAYQRALVCVGDLDAAAAVLVDRLNDPRLRIEALAALQDHPFLISAEAMPLCAELEAAFRALRQRPEVSAAIAAHGRIDQVDLRQSHLGAF